MIELCANDESLFDEIMSNVIKSFNNDFCIPLQNVQVKIVKISSEEYTPANSNSTYNQNYIKNYIKTTPSQTLFFFRNGNNYYVIDYKKYIGVKMILINEWLDLVLVIIMIYQIHQYKISMTFIIEISLDK